MFAAAAAVAGLCGAFTACGAARPSGADAGGGLDVRAENAKLPGDCGLARLGTAHQVEGWFDRTSVAPGEPVRLFSSTTAQTLTVSVFRVGWYDGHGCRLVEHRGPLPGVRQPVPGPAPGTNTIATSWRQTTTFATSSWPAGDYLIRLDDADGWQAYVPLTVRGPAQPGRIVILNAVTTWQAYNAWGGYSLYHGPSGRFTDRAKVVSFDRPYDFGDGAADFTGNEQPLVMLAERLGLPVRYATDIDLHADPHLLDGARAVISLGHDEYYSREMRAALTAARDRGVNIAFLGANAVYRRIRLSASPTGPNRTQAGYKIAAEDPLYGVDNSRITANWPSPPNADPESSLTGGMYQCNPAHADMTVWNPRHWLLAGTGTATGDRIPGVIGPEYDRVDASVPTPGQIEVLGHSPVTCRDDPDFADVTYYTAPSGAGVFDAGTSAWVCALNDVCGPGVHGPAPRAFTTQVTANLLRAFAAGTAGRAHPAARAVPTDYREKADGVER
ncbi:N,N-dimethylformamidase beta subunit family domain-containing protein [Parafrankia sp. BMG5.11]|uniref:N,N-dimethylformamidase beta subunit family domain-containing protein n=1 Tax=Parafrankia sp. BMG5.11 TaxID=222540 RepID=UPI000DD3B537|nr:N,N-dimethylformamidase beta subunit family domain-containing protein [Parafrankia sp. BMG5.11]TCJ33018.1 hypothetical protein E0504_40125 [Parafrankia sp. BMG5.11]